MWTWVCTGLLAIATLGLLWAVAIIQLLRRHEEQRNRDDLARALPPELQQQVREEQRR